MALASHPLSWAMLSGRRRQFLEREGARVAIHCVRGGESIGRPLVLAVAAAVLPLLAGCADPVPTLTYAERYCYRTLAEVDCHDRSEEHTSELQSLMRISYAVFCLKKKKTNKTYTNPRSKQRQNIKTRRHDHIT